MNGPRDDERPVEEAPLESTAPQPGDTVGSGQPGDHLIRPSGTGSQRLSVTPESAGWRYLSFAVHRAEPGEEVSHVVEGQETAVVPLAGGADLEVGGLGGRLSRDGVFSEMGSVAYAPPGADIAIQAGADGFDYAIGSAPAEGRLPPRFFAPAEMPSVLRGGGAAHRQVNDLLGPALPAERLILFEVYVPRGTWSGWPPHCHDGFGGSPYLEETYWFRLDRPEGFAMHRNWRVDEAFDEVLLARDGDVALVTKGFHSTVACPGSNMYFLNYLAGDAVGEERAIPPCFHDDHTWIEADWSAGEWTLPVVSP